MRTPTRMIAVLVAFLSLSAFGDGIYSNYVNTNWYLVHSRPNEHQFVLVEVPRPLGDNNLPLSKVSGLSINVRGDNRALEMDDLFIACRFHDLPSGITIAEGASSPGPASLVNIPYLVFQKPSGVIQIPPFFFPKPYVLPEGHSLYLSAQIKYEGLPPAPQTIGPVTCAAAIFWEE